MCLQELEKLGVKDKFEDPRVKDFYENYCEAISVPHGNARKEVFFMSSPSEIASRYA